MKTIPHNFKFQAVLMTPENAQALLDTNHELQRRHKPRRIQQYTQDMVANNWPLTYECVAIDENEKLINGQNRLSAIVRAGVPVPIMLCRNVPTQIMTVIDTGMPRNVVDATFVVGMDIPNRDKYIQAARRMASGFTKTHTMSNSATLDFIEKHKEALDFAFEVLPGRIQAFVRAVIARAYYSCSKTKLKEFAKILSTGISSDEGVIHFRNWLLTCKNPRPEEAFGKAEKALQTYLNNESFKGRLFPAKEELFPIPS